MTLAELRRTVQERDRVCVALQTGFDHQCKDQWGKPHGAGEYRRLSLEHVKDELMMGKRAPNDREHCVAVCYAINLRPPTKAMREAFREYLARVEGAIPYTDTWTTPDSGRFRVKP